MYIDAYNPPREGLMLEYFRRDSISYDVDTNVVYDVSSKRRTDQALGHLCYNLTNCDYIELDDTYNDVFVTWFDPSRMEYRELYFVSISQISNITLSDYVWNVKIWNYDPTLEDADSVSLQGGLLFVLPCESERALNITKISSPCNVINKTYDIVDVDHRVTGSYYNTYGYTTIDLSENVHVYLGNLYLNAYNGARLTAFGRARYDGYFASSNCINTDLGDTVTISTTYDLSNVVSVSNEGTCDTSFYEISGSYYVDMTGQYANSVCYNITLNDAFGNILFRLPLSEGGGSFVKCVKTGYLFDISPETNWAKQDDYHYNMKHGSVYNGLSFTPNMEWETNKGDTLNCETSVRLPDCPEFFRLNINPLCEDIHIFRKTAQPIFARLYNNTIQNILCYDNKYENGYALLSKYVGSKIVFNEDIQEIIETDGMFKEHLTINNNEILFPKDRLLWYIKVITTTGKVWDIRFCTGIGSDIKAVNSIEERVGYIDNGDFIWFSTRLNDWHLRNRRYINYNITDKHDPEFISTYRYVDSDFVTTDEQVYIVLSTEDKRFGLATESSSYLVVEND